MKKRLRTLLICIVVLIGGAGFLFFDKVTFLLLENAGRSRTVSVRVSPSERFSISYLHSIYRVPATEDFEISHGIIVLTGVRAEHPGVLEYYGFDETSPFHPMDRKFEALSFKVAMGEPQRLMARGRTISFDEVGEKGDPIQLRVNSISLARYLFRLLFPLPFVQFR